MANKVDHPAHYGGENNPYETIKVIEAWGLNFSLGNAIKYISRAGKKDGASKREDLLKAVWYLEHEAGLERVHPLKEDPEEDPRVEKYEKIKALLLKYSRAPMIEVVDPFPILADVLEIIRGRERQ